ncbi:MAG: pyridoxamine 5'-phosphate oxidase family protein [Desulfobulbus sp.]|jgi:uncharacterized OB-fold protein|uniref:pyridoxamine 5'-phosphate oxidase family protein n=1 Tax=Desulfobulbus sp. TaxID=895 RepID=UPI0028403B14|nr:pyridoxamine 5'-phosphate oxidase family protein [Desulfobulbus sp.]MDR2549416.1 pyridoxamine 5'-phosphate oxidase family protein [Desulfobulbus sp.]
MLNHNFHDVISQEGIVAIVSWGNGEPHVVNTWNSYLIIQENDKILIPAAGMRKTQANTEINDKVKLTVGSREEGGKKMGRGFLLEGTAKFLKSGPEYDLMKAKCPFTNRVLIVTVTSVTKTL